MEKTHLGHMSLSQGGLFHDAASGMSIPFDKVRVEKYACDVVEGEHGANPGSNLPVSKLKCGQIQ